MRTGGLKCVENERQQWPPNPRRTKIASFVCSWSLPRVTWAPREECHLLNRLFFWPPIGLSVQVPKQTHGVLGPPEQQDSATAGCSSACYSNTAQRHDVCLWCCRAKVKVSGGRSKSWCWCSQREARLPEEGRPPICRGWIPADKRREACLLLEHQFNH